jgi:UDP-galactose transporter
VQLSFYSLFPALIFGVFLKDGEEIAKNGFFDGYNAVVWTAIVLQAGGGVLVAMCINYADNIAKNFATSISIVLSFLFSVWFFEFQVTLNVCLLISSSKRTLLLTECSLWLAPQLSSLLRTCTANQTGNGIDPLQ